MSQKILAASAGRDSVAVGEIVTVRVDLAIANDLSGPLAITQFQEAGATRVFDPDRIFFVAGRHAPFRDSTIAEQVGRIRQFSEKHGIRGFYGDAVGMDHGLLPELGLIRPGMLICNADSHVCTMGALGAFGVPMGSTDMAYIFAFGETWLRVPSTIRVRYEGVLSDWVTSKDLVLATVRRLGVDGARYKTIEFAGPTLSALTVDERFTITNMAIEMGAKTGLMEPDQITRDYLAARTGDPWTEVRSDPDAEFEADISISADGLPPQVARPHLPSDVVPVDEVAGTRITQVNIGTCTNGRLVDLEQAARVLRGNRVAKTTRLIITPATEIVYRQALKQGLIEVFLDAGAVVTTPGCGACTGMHLGAVGGDDVCMTTHNRNFRGRMGHKDARIYLSSPYVAAATALVGAIANPQELNS